MQIEYRPATDLWIVHKNGVILAIEATCQKAAEELVMIESAERHKPEAKTLLEELAERMQ